MVRHFLRDDDLSPAEQLEVLDLADTMKLDRWTTQSLAGPRAVAVIFDKPSTRTRVSFSVGIAELGGYPLVIDAQSTQLGRGEPIEDTARVLDRQCAAIVWRTFEQSRVESMAAASRVPVVNALTDEYHPCHLLAGAAAAMHVRIASPAAFAPDPEILARAAKIAETTGGSVVHLTDPADGFAGADVVATDTWVSMGQEGTAGEREAPFVPFAVTGAA